MRCQSVGPAIDGRRLYAVIKTLMLKQNGRHFVDGIMKLKSIAGF